MPKPLNQPPPTSSVANMLQPGIGAAAMAKPPSPSPERLPPTPVTEQRKLKPVPANIHAEVPDQLCQFSLTASAVNTLDALADMFGRATGLKPKRSELVRAVLKALAHAMPELQREAVHIGKLSRPKNDPGNEGLREIMEDRIAKGIIAGMRASDLPETQPAAND